MSAATRHLSSYFPTASSCAILLGPMMAPMAKLDINSKYQMKSGYDIPALGYGVYQTPAAEAEAVVSHALQVGYRHVDSAVAYHNEEAAARALKKSGIPRGHLFFTSKVPPKAMSYDSAVRSVDETLRNTGLDYVDLYLLHSPYGGKEARLGAWKALVEAVQDNKVRSIGVSNYGVHHLDELDAWQKHMEKSHGEGSGGVLSINQVELHPWLSRPDIVQWCQTNGVVLQAYSPLVRATKAEDPFLKTLAAKFEKTTAQILLRWSLQKGFVPLPKSVTESRIEENKDIYDFELSDEDMRRLDTGAYEPCAWDPTISRD